MSDAKPLGGPRAVWALIGTAAAGLVAGAAASHVIGRKLWRKEADAAPAEEEAAPSTPEEFDRADPGRGRLAAWPHHIPRKGWTDILWRVGARYFGDRVAFVAGGVTFFVMLSLFPTMGAFVTIYGLFADPTQANSRLAFLYSVLPPGVAEFIGGEMQRLAENSTGALTFTLAWVLLLSLWSANGAVKVLFYGINVAYTQIERRNIVTYNLICLAFTLSGLAGVLLSSALVVGVPVVLGFLGLQDEWAHLTILRWPVLLAAYVGALCVIYRYAPDRKDARLRWLAPGAILAALLSLALSLGFSWYIQTFVRTASYGPLAAIMGFLLWTWLTVQIVLMGAEFNAEIEHQTAVDTTTGPVRPLGERGAVVADTVGARRGNPAALAFTLKHAEALSDRLWRRRIRRKRDR